MNNELKDVEVGDKVVSYCRWGDKLENCHQDNKDTDNNERR